MIEAVNSFAGKWFDFMVNSSIQLTVLFIVLIFLSYIFRKRSALFLYSLWVIFLIKALLPPSIPIPLLKNSEIIPQISIRSYTSAVTHPLTEVVETIPVVHLNSILLLLWIGIVFFLLIFVLLKNFFFHRKLRQAHPVKEPFLVDNYEKENLELSRIRLYIQERISSPFTLNLRRPRIYLPPEWTGWDNKQKQAVLMHEFAHIKRKDLWVNLIQNIIQILYFFHPAVWMANRYMSVYREQACDDYVISRLNNKALEYSKMIISSLDRSRGFKRYSSFVNCFVQGRQALIKRFEYLINRKEEIMQKFKATEKIVLGVLCIFALVLSLRSVERSAALQEKLITSEDQRPRSNEIYVRYDTPPIPRKGFSGLAESVTIPEETMSNKVEGRVFLTIHVNKSGETKTSSDIRTGGDCGYAEVEAVIDALKIVQWEAALKKENPIDSEIDLTFVFKLDEDTNKIRVEVIPPPPPPPLPPLPPEMDASPLAKNPPLPPSPNAPARLSPKDILIPSPQIAPRPKAVLLPKVLLVPPLPPEPALPYKPEADHPPMKKALPLPTPTPQPVPPLEPATAVLASAVPLPTIPPLPDKAVPAPPPPPQTPWENPEFFSDRELDKKPEPVIGMEKVVENIRASEKYQKNKKFAQGILILGILIDETGKLNAVLVLKPSGHKGLDQTIIDFMWGTKWKPGEKDGSPIKSKRILTFSFKD